MSSLEVTIDFETHDPHLKTLGAGWAHGNIQILGAGVKINDEKTVYLRNTQEIVNICSKADILIAHNAQYDIGLLYMLGLNTKDKTIVDTMTLSKLYNNNEKSYSLSHLSKTYLNDDKKSDIFAEIVKDNLLYTNSKGASVNVQCPKKLKKFAMENLHIVDATSPETVEEYCIHDVDLTYALYQLRKSYVTERDSKIINILLDMRYRGVRVDIHRIREVRGILKAKEDNAINNMRKLSENYSFNPNSSMQLAEIYAAMEIPFPRTAPTEKHPYGSPSFTKAWVGSQEDPFSKALYQYKHYLKSRRDFCDKALAYQELLPDHKKGRVYPEFKLYGATATGRFSCSNPNIQQIPSRDKEIGPMVRSFFLPEQGEQFYHADFSAQEPRIQVHYASLIGAEGASLLKQEYIKNPKMDFHQTVADICSIGRTEAKTIGLGLAYGMGLQKLSESLNVTEGQARILRDQYNDRMPYLADLSKYSKKAIESRGYIFTYNGRKLHNEYGNDKFTGKRFSFGYKAVNKLIQGSSVDQLINVMIALDKEGISMLLSEHDAISFSIKDEETAAKAKHIMETAVKLEVPMIVDMFSGNNWAEAKG